MSFKTFAGRTDVFTSVCSWVGALSMRVEATVSAPYQICWAGRSRRSGSSNHRRSSCQVPGKKYLSHKAGSTTLRIIYDQSHRMADLRIIVDRKNPTATVICAGAKLPHFHVLKGYTQQSGPALIEMIKSSPELMQSCHDLPGGRTMTDKLRHPSRTYHSSLLLIQRQHGELRSGSKSNSGIF